MREVEDTAEVISRTQKVSSIGAGSQKYDIKKKINIKQYLTDTQPIYYNSLRLSFFLRERESRHCGVKQSISQTVIF